MEKRSQMSHEQQRIFAMNLRRSAKDIGVIVVLLTVSTLGVDAYQKGQIQPLREVLVTICGMMLFAVIGTLIMAWRRTAWPIE